MKHISVCLLIALTLALLLPCAFAESCSFRIQDGNSTWIIEYYPGSVISQGCETDTAVPQTPTAEEMSQLADWLAEQFPGEAIGELVAGLDPAVFQTAMPQPVLTPVPQTAMPQHVSTPAPQPVVQSTACPAPLMTTVPVILSPVSQETPRPTQAPVWRPAPTAAPTASPTVSTGDYTTFTATAQEQKLLNLINADRAKNGLPPLVLDPELSNLARLKSSDMNDNHYFAHESPTYGNAAQMLSSFQFDYRGVGENIAHHANVEKAQAAFMSSDGHRRNVLGSQWDKVGIGVSIDENGFVYVTELFAR